MISKGVDLKGYIRDIPDWPKKGILFRDITPLLADPKAFVEAVDALCADFKEAGIEYIAAVEARGFIFGAAVAQKLGVGFIPIRKKGKLPWQTESVTYDLEYGTDALCIHKDAVHPGERVLIVDDLLATGGTLAATANLIKRLEGEIVEMACVIELLGLNGREKLKGHSVFSLLTYD